MSVLTKEQLAQLKKQGNLASASNLQANQSYQSLWAPDHTTKANWLCQLKIGAKGGLAVLMKTETDSYKVATASGFYTLLEEHYEEHSDVLVNDSMIWIEACYRSPKPMPDQISDPAGHKSFQAQLDRLVKMYGANGQSHIDEWQAALDNPDGVSQQLLGLTIVSDEA